MGLVQQASLGVDLNRFARAGNISNIEALVDPLRARRVTSDNNDFAVGHDHWGVLQQRIEDVLAAFHGAHADELGPDGPRLKRMSLPRLDDGLYRALMADLVASGKVERTGPWLHLRGHSVAPSARERALLESVLYRLLDTPFDPPWVRDLAKVSGHPESLLRPALIRAAKRGEVFQIVRDLFYHPLAVCDLAVLAGELHQADGEVRAAAFRDQTGLGRKRAIQILEFFDRVGFTRRVRDRHLVRPDNPFATDLGKSLSADEGIRIASAAAQQVT
jgi:selenocysteine-specific elongation factor